ncbi:MAG: Rpn family recombination-promoting nuclease/putative transposase [Oscillospiraceae bacterium]|nr:Rpn family recombination-promoting nuclease/putative transposase [Oscillospiraceae bacterium]
MLTKPFLISVKNDIGFRLFFADERNIEFLQGLLKSILKLDDGEYEVIEILDPHLLREFHGDKLGIVDVKVKTKTGKIIHIEIQLKVRPGMEERIIYYDAKLITEQIGSSDKYKDLKRVISIIITEETLIKASPLYHHRFTFFDPNANIELSDLIEIHTLELNKLPDNFDGTELCDWAKFIAAKSEEELEMVASRNTQISKAVVKLRELSADEKARDMYERQEKARRDHEWAMDYAREMGIEEGIKEGTQKREQELIESMKLSGMSEAEIDRILSFKRGS